MRILKIAAMVVLTGATFMSVAAAAPVTTQCGRLISSVTKTNIDFFTSASELPPVFISGAGVNVNIPAGVTRCVRVRFSAVAACPHACFLRAVASSDAGTNELNPAWTSNPLRFSQDGTNGGTAHSFEWVERLGPGQHLVRISFQTGNEIDPANIGPWTNTVEVLE